MDKHIKNVTEHKFITELNESLVLVNEVLENKENLNSNWLFTASRIQQVLTHLINIYNSTDPLMINVNKIDQFTVHGSNLKSYLTSSRRDFRNLSSANAAIDSLIECFSYFIYPKTGKEIVGLRSATEKYHSVIQSYLSEIEEQINELRQVTKEVSTSAQTDIQNYEERLEHYEKQLKGRMESLESALDDYKQSLDGDYENKYYEIVKTIEDRSQSLTQELEALKLNYQKIIDNHIENVEEIIGVVAGQTISHGFGKIANEEKEEKEKWNKFVLWLFGALVLYAISMVALSFFIDFTWDTILLRALGGVGAIGAFIAYCSKQAKNHADVERRSRKMELELAALDSYFAGYDKETMFEVRKVLAERFFGKDDFIGGKPLNKEVDLKEITELLKTIKK